MRDVAKAVHTKKKKGRRNCPAAFACFRSLQFAAVI
jgi:hypothetical protein